MFKAVLSVVSSQDILQRGQDERMFVISRCDLYLK